MRDIISKTNKGGSVSDTNYATLIDNPCPIDPFNEEDPNYEKYKSILEDLQGGIIKNYGRNYSLYISIQFNQEQLNEVKKWIRDEIAPKVTSTWKQLDNTRTYRKMRSRDSSYIGEMCTNFFLSYAGYRTLGLDPTNLADTLFKKGIREDWENSYRLTKDPKEYWYNPPENWDIGKERIDALILLAHDNLEELKNEAEATINTVQKSGEVVACEAGYVLRDPTKDIPVGPFGFADGISQPLFLQSDYEKYCESQNQNTEQWDPKASLNLVLVKDPFGEPYSYGSYCVFQKLETNYKDFNDKVGELAGELGCDREKAGALVIGRFKDGTPIALSDQPNQKDMSSIPNSFNYADDYEGNKCPIQAHIRKTNPRKDGKSTATAIATAQRRRENNRIFRAGVTYFDDPTQQQKAYLSKLQQCLNKLDYLDRVSLSHQTLEEKIEKINGLLFVCFQRTIANQFALIQKKWADEARFPRTEGYKYLDPVIGHPAFKGKEEYPDPQTWFKNNNEKPGNKYFFYGCVKNRGGEFFFAPSISSLKNSIH